MRIKTLLGSLGVLIAAAAGTATLARPAPAPAWRACRDHTGSCSLPCRDYSANPASCQFPGRGGVSAGKRTNENLT